MWALAVVDGNQAFALNQERSSCLIGGSINQGSHRMQRNIVIAALIFMMLVAHKLLLGRRCHIVRQRVV